MNKLNNKWFRAVLPAILLHLSIGSVYCWSLFVTPISEYIGKSPQQVQFAFSLAIFTLGLSAAFGGNLVEKNIRKSTLVSMICFCSGLLATALAIHFKSLIGIYCGYGFLMGVGLGIGYLSPIKNLMIWFKNNKGFATGIAVCSFGFASAIASPLITYLISKYSLPQTFIALGIIYILPMFIAHLLIKKPNGYVEPIDNSDFKAMLMFKNKTFIAIFIMLFINISCGLSLISVASPMMKEMNLNISTIALVVGIMGIFNGSGRLVFSAVSDKMKNRQTIYKVIFGLSVGIIFATLLNNKLIIVALLIISACYGAGFSNLPSLLSDKFGMKNISKIHGISLISWGLSGLCGNQISTLIKNITGSYLNVLWLLIVAYTIGLIVCLKLSKNNNEIKGE